MDRFIGHHHVAKHTAESTKSEDIPTYLSKTQDAFPGEDYLKATTKPHPPSIPCFYMDFQIMGRFFP